MDIYWTTAGGDEMRIADVDTGHPRLQETDRVMGWRDCHPKNYPRSLFALAVSLLGALAEMDLLDNPIIIDCGVQTSDGAEPKTRKEG